MPSLSKKQLFLAALTAAFLLVLIAFLTVPAPVPHALQVSILGQTNNPSGAPIALVGVTNHTGQARFFYVVAEVPAIGSRSNCPPRGRDSSNCRGE